MVASGPIVIVLSIQMCWGGGSGACIFYFSLVFLGCLVQGM